MYLQRLAPKNDSDTAPLRDRRSLSNNFVLMVKDSRNRFCAESCVHVMRRANALLGADIYSWTVLEANACTLSGSEICNPDQTLVLIGGVETPWRPEAEQLHALRSAIRNAARVCVIGSAVFVPMAAGVLGAKQAAVHPSFRTGVKESSPHTDIVPGATCHHKSLSSATGPAAALRMMVDLIGAREGDFTRTALAHDLGLEETNPNTGEHWRLQRKAKGCDVISDALRIMADHLEDTLSVAQIADLVGVSPRKMERSFSDRLDRSPLKVYRDLRLDRAHDLMAQTALPLSEVAVACGFSNVTLMKRWFFQKYGEAPADIRRYAFEGLCVSS